MFLHKRETVWNNIQLVSMFITNKSRMIKNFDWRKPHFILCGIRVNFVLKSVCVLSV